MSDRTTPDQRRPKITRREMLRQSSFLTVGLAATPVPGWPRSWFLPEEVVVPFTDIPENFTGRRPMNPEPHPGASLIAQDRRNLTESTTPIEDFFVVSHYDYPVVDPAAYRLRLDGLVGRPISLSLAELRARPAVERTTTFECGGNARGLLHGMVGNATWRGVELEPLLEEAAPGPNALEVHFWGADGGAEEIRGAEYEQNFARSMTMAQIAERRPILAYEMNGQPLPIVHGFPVRLVVPGWYGVAQVKWLQRLWVSPERLMTRFMARDYVTLQGFEENGGIRWVETSVTKQRPKSVIARVTRDGDLFKIFGAAWTDGTPLRGVDVQVDGGAWQPATLEQSANPFSWTFFTLQTRGLADGEHRLASRATDTEGRTQPENLDLKRTRWENNELFHRTIRVS
ncbi:MAG TPA: molybdopterin-dependent oxidoreductase [Longimicrobiaceae bacterium]|nr:molybdopterin-dependent oxidoreductase [Longimicrobiaceae bacterium]